MLCSTRSESTSPNVDSKALRLFDVESSANKSNNAVNCFGLEQLEGSLADDGGGANPEDISFATQIGSLSFENKLNIILGWDRLV